MKFSIIIPVYKVEKYLHQCVDSVLCQTFKGFELILVDDGSPDSCPVICDSYAKKDARVIVIHQKNAGQAAARNVGMKLAQGEYVIFIDSDDYIINSDFLLKLAERTHSHPDLICYKFSKYYDNSNKLVPSSFCMPQFFDEDTYAIRLSKLIEADAFYCAPWSKAIRLELLINNDIYFENGLLSEDQDWYYKVVTKAQTIENIDTAFIAYRQRAGSTSRTWSSKNMTDTLHIISKWKGLMEADGKNPINSVLLNSLGKLYCNLLIGCCSYKGLDKNAYIKRLQQLAVLLQYDKNPRVRKMSFVYRITGIRILFLFIKLAVKIKV